MITENQRRGIYSANTDRDAAIISRVLDDAPYPIEPDDYLEPTMDSAREAVNGAIIENDDHDLLLECWNRGCGTMGDRLNHGAYIVCCEVMNNYFIDSTMMLSEQAL